MSTADSPAETAGKDGIEAEPNEQSNATTMGRRRMMAVSAGAVLTLYAAGATSVAARMAGELNFDSEYAQEPELPITYRIAEHTDEMDSPLEYVDDNGEDATLADVGASVYAGDEEEDDPVNPLAARADRFMVGDYSLFPRDETREDADGEEEDVSALDAQEWTADAELTLEDTSSEAGGEALSVVSDGVTEASSMTFDRFEITSGVGRRYFQTVANISWLEEGATISARVHDGAGNYKPVDIAAEEGYGQVVQMQLGDITTEGEDFGDVQEVEIEVADGDAEFELVALNLHRESRWEFGVREVVDEDDDDELDTETIYEPNGSYEFTSLATLGDQIGSFDLISDLEVETVIRGRDLPADAADFEFSEADRYAEDERFEMVLNIDLPTAYDLDYVDIGDVTDTVAHPSGRHLEVSVATGLDDQLDLDDADDEEGWTQRTDEYGSIGDEVTLTSTATAGDVTAVLYDILLTEDEGEDLRDTTAAVGPTGDPGGRGGIVGFIMSPLGVVTSAITGWALWKYIPGR